MTNPKLRLILFFVTSFAAILFGFLLLGPEDSETAFRAFGYGNILFLIAAYLFALLYQKTGMLWQWLRQPRSLCLIAASLAAAFFLYSREGGGFKIFFDEQMLSNVALSLYKHHLPVVRESSFIDYASFEMIDKRPLLFPGLLSLVHTVTGYRIENAFYLNFAVTSVFVGLLYCILKRLVSKTAGIYAVALTCCMPLVSQNSSSGSFDLLNLVCAMLCLWHAMDFWKTRSDSDLAKLLIAAALTSNVRYESALVIIPVGILLLVSWIQARKLSIPLTLVWLPLTFLPLAWQLNYIKTQPMYWQFAIGEGRSFSPDYLPYNLYAAFRFLLVPNLGYAGSPFVGAIGLLGLIAILVLCITRRSEIFHQRPDRIAALAIAAALLAQFLLVLCFTFGQLNNIIVSRLGLPFILILLATGGILLGLAHDKSQKLRPFAILAILLSAFYASKMYATIDYSDKDAMKARSEWLLDFAHAQPKGNYLYISLMPRIFEIEGIHNISSTIARARGEAIYHHLELMTYDEVFVVEFGAIDMVEGVPTKRLLSSTQMGPAFKLETIDEVSLLAHNFVRLSKLVGYDPSLPATPESDQVIDPNQLQFNSLSVEQQIQWRRSLP